MTVLKQIKLLTLVPILFFAGSNIAVSQTIITPANLKWIDAKDLPDGAKFAVLAGNPRQKGHFVARLKLPANYIVPAHSHYINEYDTVISGTFYLGQGNVADAKSGVALAQGDFAILPANTDHYGYTKGETILEISSDGPWGMIYHTNG